MSFRGATRRGNPYFSSISLPCQREVARAQPVTEGFRPQESYLGNGIPQSSPAAMPAPFHKGATVEKILQCSQKIHAAVTILPQLSGILYASPERMKIFLLLLSLLYKHTQANGPDHPGQGRLPFCRHCGGMLQGNIEKLCAARSRANSLSSS